MCGQACSLVKSRTFNPAAARIRIIDNEDSGVTVAVVCQQCAEPVCLPVCPTGALQYRACEIGDVDERLMAMGVIRKTILIKERHQRIEP